MKDCFGNGSFWKKHMDEDIEVLASAKCCHLRSYSDCYSYCLTPVGHLVLLTNAGLDDRITHSTRSELITVARHCKENGKRSNQSKHQVKGRNVKVIRQYKTRACRKTGVSSSHLLPLLTKKNLENSNMKPFKAFSFPQKFKEVNSLQSGSNEFCSSPLHYKCGPQNHLRILTFY